MANTSKKGPVSVFKLLNIKMMFRVRICNVKWQKNLLNPDCKACKMRRGDLRKDTENIKVIHRRQGKLSTLAHN